MAINIKACGISDIGLRSNNEDVFAELSDERCYILADGMGGHQGGEIASREAIEALISIIRKNTHSLQKSLHEVSEFIHQAICDVNSYVFKMGRSAQALKGMGTTLCLLLVHDEGIVFAHVGDSRIYRWRGGALELLTKDHSLLRELVDLGQINEDQAEEFYYRNIITRAIGTEPGVKPTIRKDQFLVGDLYILCSDGLSDLLSSLEMEAILKEFNCLSLAAAQLISLSKKKGGHDNITLLLVQICSTDE